MLTLSRLEKRRFVWASLFITLGIVLNIFYAFGILPQLGFLGFFLIFIGIAGYLSYILRMMRKKELPSVADNPYFLSYKASATTLILLIIIIFSLIVYDIFFEISIRLGHFLSYFLCLTAVIHIGIYSLYKRHSS